MELEIGDLFSTPDLFLFEFDDDRALFAQMDRGAYKNSIFLDRRIAALSPHLLEVPLSQLEAHPRRSAAAPARLGWIFHIAQCGSTLLSRALDMERKNLVLREPLVLRQLGVDAASGSAASPAWRQRLDLAVSLLGRRYGQEPVIIKANVPVNFIVPQLMAMDHEAPAIFLYFNLERYLLAVLRTDNHRVWVERVTSEVWPSLGFEPESGDATDPAVRAAALWLAQMRVYADALQRYPRARCLDAEYFFNNPDSVMSAAFDLFGMSVSDAEREAIVASDLFSTYSKNPNFAFDNAARLERQRSLRRELAGDLAAARTWVEGQLALSPLPVCLPRPLAGPSAVLLAEG